LIFNLNRTPPILAPSVPTRRFSVTANLEKPPTKMKFLAALISPELQAAFALNRAEMMCGLGYRIMKITVTVEDCRFYVHECMRWAEETDNEKLRQGFLDMVWMKLAMDGNEAQGPPTSIAAK
jgi:hypothetical protein